MKYIPQTPGEKKVTLRVAPQEGELIRSNNEISTFVTVLKGGLNVLYLQGPNFTWEYKFLARAVAASPDIQVELKILRGPIQEGEPGMEDAEFAPGRYDVYILGDLPADRLTRTQQRLLTEAVEKGAGLIMLGGRSSFGAGGWAGTELARILPVKIHPGDGQIEPEGGLKFVPDLNAPEGYMFQVGGNRIESRAALGRAAPDHGHEPVRRPQAERERPGPDGRAPARAADGRRGDGPGPHHRLRRRDLGLGPRLGRGPAGPPQVLATGDLLARPQGRPGREPGQDRARPPPDRRGSEDRDDRHRPRFQGRADPEPHLRDESHARGCERPVGTGPALQPGRRGARLVHRARRARQVQGDRPGPSRW